MLSYALFHDGAFKNLAVKTAVDHEAAKALVEKSSWLSGQAITVEADLLTEFSGPTLVNLFNALGGEPPVQRFKTRTDGARRTFALLESKYQNQSTEVINAETSPVEETPAATAGEDDMAKKAKKTKVKKTKVTRVRKVKVTKQPRGETTQSITNHMVSRARGATKNEIIVAVMDKISGRQETKVNNSVRSMLSIMGRAKGAEKVTKVKEDGRGNVYYKK